MNKIKAKPLTFSKRKEDRKIIEALNDDKTIEETIVALPNAIIDPGTVVIKSLNTLVTVAAVETARGPNQATLRAQLRWVHRRQHCHKVHARVRLQISRVNEPDEEPKNEAEDEEALVRVENPIVRILIHRFIILPQDREGR